MDWSDAVEAVQRISDRIGAALTLDQPKAEDVSAQWHPGRAARVMAGDVFVGMVGELHPHVNEALGFPAHSAAFELDLTALFATLSGKPVQAKPISTFPPVKQDLAFTVSTDVTAAELKQVIVDAAGSSLESIELFDVYTGDQLARTKSPWPTRSHSALRIRLSPPKTAKPSASVLWMKRPSWVRSCAPDPDLPRTEDDYERTGAVSADQHRRTSGDG